MKFSRDFLVSKLRKRERGERDAPVGGEPKRSRQLGSDSQVQPPAVILEATSVEDDEREMSPPMGVPIGDPVERGSPEIILSPAQSVGESTRDVEAAKADLPGPSLPTEVDVPVPASSGTLRTPPSAPQPPSENVGYKSCLSETILKLAILPRFQDKLRRATQAEAFDTMFTAALQTANGLFVLREGLDRAESRNASLDKELVDTRARESKALHDLQVMREDYRTWRGRAEKELQSLDAQLCEVRARLLPTEEKLKETSLRLEHTENRADSAEATARDAMEKLVLAEKDTKNALDKAAAAMVEAQKKMATIETEAREKIAVAEAKAQEKVAIAEAKARDAIKEYKGSPDFEAEFQEAALDAFVEGFEKCKRILARQFNLKDLERFRPVDDEGVSDIEVEDVVSGAVATETLAVEEPPAEEPTANPDAEEEHSKT